MSYAEILVPLTGEVRDLIALKTAIAIARPFKAHITALFVHLDPKYALSYGNMVLDSSAIIELERDTEAMTKQAKSRAKEIVLAVLAQENIPLSDRAAPGEQVRCSFKIVPGLFKERVLEAALLSDVVVFGAMLSGPESDVWESSHQALLEAGKPIILANESPEQFTNKISVGWDGSPSAAHAVSAALPLMKAAKQVDILSIEMAHRQIEAKALIEYLALHGVSAKSRTIPCGKSGVGMTLQEAAAQEKSDMLVMGGYGHNYWREMLFGGVTDDVRRHTSLPVFVMH